MFDLAESASRHCALWAFKLIVLAMTVACAQGCVPPDDVMYDRATVVAVYDRNEGEPACQDIEEGTIVAVSYTLAPPSVPLWPEAECEVAGELFECRLRVGQDVAWVVVSVDLSLDTLIIRSEPIGGSGAGTCRWVYRVTSVEWY